MQQSLLQLESSAITRVRIEANKNFPQNQVKKKFTDFSESGFESVVEYGPAPHNPRLYFVKLEIQLLGTEASQPPYLIDLEIVGTFSLPNAELPVNETLVEYNGPAVLYGSIRELVMQVTSRGPFPPIVLPTVSFVNPETKVEPDGRLSKE
jgi:preprotein translocase subunit SecB